VDVGHRPNHVQSLVFLFYYFRILSLVFHSIMFSFKDEGCCARSNSWHNMLHPWRKLLCQDNLAYVIYASNCKFLDTALVAIKIATNKMPGTCFLAFIDTFESFKKCQEWAFFFFFFFFCVFLVLKHVKI
jgi:hypothetical protein